ncbi:hypothetical protein L9F63_000784 [Diploptera punctata]|uniref:C2H2-type domain-containing protein n=1 Tax=Diploptera punctata TaxID=6984 RepID=A0AAD8ET24_DIPPU|nr:hypothetical protein L9F63_000784 [Diploptera punctata]
MQTNSDFTSSLGCSDCKIKFKSASSLLQHFAQHVSQETFRHGSNNSANCMAVPYRQKKKKAHTILERVLKRNSVLRHMTSANQCDPGPSFRNSDIVIGNLSSSSLNLQTSSPEHSQSEICDEESEIPNLELRENNSFVESCLFVSDRQNHVDSLNTSSASTSTDVPLFKCDFQKRIESCITKLVSKRESDIKLAKPIEETQNKIIVNGNFDKISLLPDEDFLENSKTFIKNGENSFNSLEFCLVSKGEGDENEKDLISEARFGEDANSKDYGKKIPRNASSRKQKMPKKVHYIENGELKDSDMEESTVSGNTTESSMSLKRKYQCNLCSKVFGWSTDLKRHILTHTGERPFKCKLCKATFTRNFLLQKHQSKIHKSQFGSPEDILIPVAHFSSREDILKFVENKMEQECMEVSAHTQVAVPIEDENKTNSSMQLELEYSGDKELVQSHSNNIHFKNENSDLRYNRISYEIISHEALNVL